MIKTTPHRIDLNQLDKEIFCLQEKGLFPIQGETFRLINEKGEYIFYTTIGFGLEYCEQRPTIYFTTFEKFENIGEISLFFQDLDKSIQIPFQQWKELDQCFPKLNLPKVNSYYLHTSTNNVYEINGYSVGFESNLNGKSRNIEKLEIKIKYSRFYGKDEKKEELKCLKVFERPINIFLDYDNEKNCKRFQHCTKEGTIL